MGVCAGLPAGRRSSGRAAGRSTPPGECRTQLRRRVLPCGRRSVLDSPRCGWRRLRSDERAHLRGHQGPIRATSSAPPLPHRARSPPAGRPLHHRERMAEPERRYGFTWRGCGGSGLQPTDRATSGVSIRGAPLGERGHTRRRGSGRRAAEAEHGSGDGPAAPRCRPVCAGDGLGS